MMQKTTECLIVFVSVDSHGRPLPVSAFTPGTPGDMALAERAKNASGREPRGRCHAVAVTVEAKL
jgi:acyl-CoA hydrolase